MSGTAEVGQQSANATSNQEVDFDLNGISQEYPRPRSESYSHQYFSMRHRGKNGGAGALSSTEPAEMDKDETSDSQRPTDWKSITAGVVYATLPKWLDFGIIGLLIFGGCCGTVFALEAIIQDEPAAGALITFVQFATTALFTIPGFLSWSAGPRAFFLSPRAIPLRSWVVYTLFFVTVNLLNNWAFAYRISVPLHIILRSGGPVASMGIGYIYNGRRYSRMQVLAVVLLTFGVVGAALADAEAQGRSIDLSYDYSGNSAMTFLTGFTILLLAMLLSAFQGVYVDRLYAQHGNSHWREALLYSHMLSLPFFLPTYPQLTSQFRTLMSSPSILSSLASVLGDGDVFRQNATTPLAHMGSITSHSSVTPTGTAVVAAAADNFVTRFHQHGGAVSWFLSRGPGYYFVQYVLAQTPSQIFFLLINALTQYVCIRGVYLLAAKSSSLNVTIVLNIRKLVSLLFSIYLFGNSLAAGVLIGAGFVFLGGALYGVEGARLKNKKAAHTQQMPQKTADVSNKIKV